jgi:hypothetical protein
MAGHLNTCTAIERGVVGILWAKGMAANDIHKEMLPMYGEHCLSRQAVYNWVQKFRQEERTSFEDEHRVGRLVEIATLATLKGVEDIIRADRRVSIDAVATAMGCSHLHTYLNTSPTVSHVPGNLRRKILVVAVGTTRTLLFQMLHLQESVPRKMLF